MGWTYMIHFLIIMSQSTKIVMVLSLLGGLAQDWPVAWPFMEGSAF